MMEIKNSKKNIVLVLKHMIVSLLSVCVEITIFWLLNIVLNSTILEAHVIAFICATFLGFILHSKITFSIGKLKGRNALFFCFQAMIMLIFGYQVLKFLVLKSIDPLLAKLIQLSINFTINVLIGKYITFKK